MEAPETITCVECGATAGRLTSVPEDEGFLPGDVVAFVCPDCGQRFDIVLEDEADQEDDADQDD
jgi:Zn finger protein HypA/HybF involved in hydrogenase expression